MHPRGGARCMAWNRSNPPAQISKYPNRQKQWIVNRRSKYFYMVDADIRRQLTARHDRRPPGGEMSELQGSKFLACHELTWGLLEKTAKGFGVCVASWCCCGDAAWLEGNLQVRTGYRNVGNTNAPCIYNVCSDPGLMRKWCRIMTDYIHTLSPVFHFSWLFVSNPQHLSNPVWYGIMEWEDRPWP